VRGFRRSCNGVCEREDVCRHYSSAVFEVHPRTNLAYRTDPPGVGCGDWFPEEMAKGGKMRVTDLI